MKKIAWCLVGGFGAVSGLLLGLGMVLILTTARPAAACTSGPQTTLPVASGTIVAATVYDDAGGGAFGLGLAGHYAYAELGLRSAGDTDQADADALGVALGLGRALAPLTTLRITAPDGRSVLAEKRDIGVGGPPIEGRHRAIDLWTTTRAALGLGPHWSGLVKVSPGPSGALSAEAPPAVGGAGCADGGNAAAEAAAGSGSIVGVAQGQLGVRATGDCQPYGPCEEWCSLFVTWVWQHAGIAVPSLGFSGAFYDWAAAHTAVYPPTATPQPGWAVFFGTGPADAGTSVHVAVVESVLADGEITIINGNFAGRVMRTGPCEPVAAQAACQAPGPIYGYAAPTPTGGPAGSA
jgi:hypothetical protein